jgi:hypothetical protein
MYKKQVDESIAQINAASNREKDENQRQIDLQRTYLTEANKLLQPKEFPVDPKVQIDALNRLKTIYDSARSNPVLPDPIKVLKDQVDARLKEGKKVADIEAELRADAARVPQYKAAADKALEYLHSKAPKQAAPKVPTPVPTATPTSSLGEPLYPGGPYAAAYRQAIPNQGFTTSAYKNVLDQTQRLKNEGRNEDLVQYLQKVMPLLSEYEKGEVLRSLGLFG